MTRRRLTIAVLGASGLIGEAVASWLMQEGFPVVPIARHFNKAQKYFFGEAAIECHFVDDPAALEKIFKEHRIEIVFNSVGILQDGPSGNIDAVHAVFVDRLVKLIESCECPAMLIHLSIPGDDREDKTSFSRTKREAERVIAASSIPFVILRPGFTVAPSAYGGSAAMRAMAMLPFEFPVQDMGQPFYAVDVIDVARTVVFVAHGWCEGKQEWNAIWDVMAQKPTYVGDVIKAFRQHLGGPKSLMALPSWIIALAAHASDFVAHVGWSPPLRSTAIQEMRRGVSGDPKPWIESTGIEPVPLEIALARTPASVQEKWFAQLYFIKALVLLSLVLFWVLSGLIALTFSFGPASAILISHGFSSGSAVTITAVSSVFDIAIGLAIAFKKSCRTGLLLGICLSIFYMLSALAITPDLWLEPLGALVKTGPAIVLMLVALCILENR